MSAARPSDMLIAIWSFCEPEDREAFVSYLAISGHINSPSDGDAFAAVTGKAQLANAAGVEPPPSDESSEPAAAIQAKTKAADAPPPASVATIRKLTPADWRPHCQRPEACAASGLKHCHGCARAAGIEVAA